MEERKLDSQDVSSTVQLAKEACHIITPNPDMSDDEIRTVAKWIGQYAPDTVWVDGKPQFRRLGISTMLFVVLSEFPSFYEKHGLSQFN